MIRHSFISAKADGADNSLIRPSDWNAVHTSPPFVIPIVGALTTWTNQPATATEFTGTPRTKVDLSAADQVRIVLCVAVVGFTGATLAIQYSTDQSAWSTLTTAAVIDALNVQVSTWTSIPTGAKADVFVRVLGTGGNAVVDPQIKLVQLQVR